MWTGRMRDERSAPLSVAVLLALAATLAVESSADVASPVAEPRELVVDAELEPAVFEPLRYQAMMLRPMVSRRSMRSSSWGRSA